MAVYPMEDGMAPQHLKSIRRDCLYGTYIQLMLQSVSWQFPTSFCLKSLSLTNVAGADCKLVQVLLLSELESFLATKKHNSKRDLLCGIHHFDWLCKFMHCYRADSKIIRDANIDSISSHVSIAGILRKNPDQKNDIKVHRQGVHLLRDVW